MAEKKQKKNRLTEVKSSICYAVFFVWVLARGDCEQSEKRKVSQHALNVYAKGNVFENTAMGARN